MISFDSINCYFFPQSLRVMLSVDWSDINDVCIILCNMHIFLHVNACLHVIILAKQSFCFHYIVKPMKLKY